MGWVGLILFRTLFTASDQATKLRKKITQLGSNWNNGTNAEPFYWNLNNSVGNRNRNISGQLEYAIKLVDYQP